MDDVSCFAPRSAFADLSAVPRTSDQPGVLVCEREGLGLASVASRKLKSALLGQRLRELYGIQLPLGPQYAVAGGLGLAGIGPGYWLAMREGMANTLAMSLEVELGALASVTDQSDSYAVLRLSGPNVRDALCKLVPVDLHACAFKIGDAAVTVAAHIGLVLWRCADHSSTLPLFELAVFRSYATSFWKAMWESAAEFGVGPL